jgi:HK97 family phage prohead protease
VSDTFIRSVDFSLRDDGRTLHGRIVPYGEVADIVEIDETTNAPVRYREQFLPHSLAAMVQGFRARGGDASKRSNCFVPLLIDHRDNFDSMIGQAVELTDENDGAYATFRLYDDDRMTKIRSVLTESHTGLSVMFRDTRAPKLVDGVISRVQVHIAHVAATATPAYSLAGIDSIRSSEMPIVETPRLSTVRAWLDEQRQLMGANNE